MNWLFNKDREWSEAEHMAYEQIGEDMVEDGGPKGVICTCLDEMTRDYEHCPGCDGCVHATRDNLSTCPLCGEEL